MEKLEWLDYNLVSTQLFGLGTIHQLDRDTDSHVAKEIAALTHCVRAAKMQVPQRNQLNVQTCNCKSFNKMCISIKYLLHGQYLGYIVHFFVYRSSPCIL